MCRAVGRGMRWRQGTLNFTHIGLVLGRHGGELAGAVIKLVHALLRLTNALVQLRDALVKLLCTGDSLIHAIVIGIAVDRQLIG